MNCKLFKVKELQAQPIHNNIDKMQALIHNDIYLCTERARLKQAIDALYGRISGEVKLYG